MQWPCLGMCYLGTCRLPTGRYLLPTYLNCLEARRQKVKKLGEVVLQKRCAVAGEPHRQPLNHEQCI